MKYLLPGAMVLATLLSIHRPAAGASDAAASVQHSSASTVRYEADFFDRFAPRTALDMVKVVPGFTLREPDEERRGYAAAMGNVLVDGERPSAKSQSLSDILQRIPAAQVLRIDVLRGTEAGGDATGDAIIANVVRTASAGAGVWSGGFELAQQHVPAPNGFASWSGRAGMVDYGIGFNTYSLKRELPGVRRVTDAGGELQEARDETSPREFAEYALNGEMSRDAFGGRWRATGQVYRSDYEQRNTLLSRDAAGTMMSHQLLPYAEHKRSGEFGFNFDTGVGLWNWTTAAILTRTAFDSDSSVVVSDASSVQVAQFHQDLVRDSGESILRTTLTRPVGKAQRIEFGIEGAINTLDADLDLTTLTGGVPTPIAVPNAIVHVKETRGDAFVAHTWRGERWSSEVRLGAEQSQLDFSGDVSQRVDLSYLKPSLQISRAFGRQHQFRVRGYRDVEQLDFNDFASAVSLNDEVIDGGNPDLRPGTSWNIEAAVDLRLAAGVAVSVRAFHAWLDDVVDLVPIGDGTIAAPGNIDSGEKDGVQLTVAFPLAPLIPRGTLNADATLQRAAVRDPFTGQRRTISGFQRNKVKAEFRQDLRRNGLAWGIAYNGLSATTDYRVADVDWQRESPSLDVFLERDLVAGLKLRVSVVSALASPEKRRRTFYDTDRSGTVLTVEDSRYDPGRWLLLTLAGGF